MLRDSLCPARWCLLPLTPVRFNQALAPATARAPAGSRMERVSLKTSCGPRTAGRPTHAWRHTLQCLDSP
jgi:hypothetical protein